MPESGPSAMSARLTAVAVLLLVLGLGGAVLAIAAGDGGGDRAVATASASSTTTTLRPTTTSTTEARSTTTRPAEATATTASAATSSTTTSTASTTTTTTSTTPPSSSTSSTTAPAPPPEQPLPGQTVEGRAGDHGAVAIALRQARARWEAQDLPAGYAYRTRHVCFCPEQVNDVYVDAAGQVVDQQTVSGEAESTPPTIDDLFDQLQDAVDRDAASIRVSFDQLRGYPVELSIDLDERLADEEDARTVLAFRPSA